MPVPYMISVMSHDQVGIVADVTGAIKTLHGNLQDMSQTVMKGYFTMILMAEFPDNTTEDTLRKALHSLKGLSSFEIGVLPYLPEPPAPVPQEGTSDNLYVLTASGPDTIGLVAAISEYLRLKNINIVDLATRCDKGIYIMMLLVALPANMDVAKLKKSLQVAMVPMGLTIELRHHAIFNKTNEI